MIRSKRKFYVQNGSMGRIFLIEMILKVEEGLSENLERCSKKYAMLKFQIQIS